MNPILQRIPLDQHRHAFNIDVLENPYLVDTDKFGRFCTDAMTVLTEMEKSNKEEERKLTNGVGRFQKLFWWGQGGLVAALTGFVGNLVITGCKELNLVASNSDLVDGIDNSFSLLQIVGISTMTTMIYLSTLNTIDPCSIQWYAYHVGCVRQRMEQFQEFIKIYGVLKGFRRDSINKHLIKRERDKVRFKFEMTARKCLYLYQDLFKTCWNSEVYATLISLTIPTLREHHPIRRELSVLCKGPLSDPAAAHKAYEQLTKRIITHMELDPKQSIVFVLYEEAHTAYKITESGVT